jgi:hypothetical protein
MSVKQILKFDGEGKAVTAKSIRLAKAEALTNSLNGETVEVKAVGKGGRKRVLVVKGAGEEAAKGEPEKKEEKEKAKPAEPKAKPKSLRRGVDYWMPTLAQVAEFVAEEVAKGAVTLTATQIREHFKVPGKMSMNTRMGQLERAGFGKFSKVNGSNTLALDIEAVRSGKAAIKGKEKAKTGKSKAEEAGGNGKDGHVA